MEHKCKEVDDNSYEDDCPYLKAAYILAGLSMMLNIRLAYSSAPYALIRFKLPENLFSVFVRRMASALELWCLPSMLLGNIIDTAHKLTADDKATYEYESNENKLKNEADEKKLIKNKKQKFHWIIIPSMVTMWLDFITYLVLLIIYVTGGDHGHVTAYYGTIAISGFIFGINMTLVYAADYRYLYLYMVGENSFPAVTSLIHYITTLILGNRRKWNSDFLIVTIDICLAIVISLVTATLWTCAHLLEPDGGADATNIKNPGGSGTSGRKDKDTKYKNLKNGEGRDAKNLWHIMPPAKDTDTPLPEVISPALMVIVGMGLVFAIYPGIAPGMIVPFYLIDKIEMVLLIMTCFPPIIVAMLQKLKSEYSPKTKYVFHKLGDSNNGFGGWKSYASTHKPGPGGSECAPDETKDVHGWFWHFFDLLIVIKIGLAVIFIYSLHYRDSNISRAIVNQPKMSTALSIIFYMCHEILLALGFQGIVGNRGVQFIMLPAQYIGALFMIFLAFYSEGYIIEYKSHDPSHWPTTGMTKWNAFCFWCKRASKITNHNLRSLFTTDLSRNLFSFSMLYSHLHIYIKWYLKLCRGIKLCRLIL